MVTFPITISRFTAQRNVVVDRRSGRPCSLFSGPVEIFRGRSEISFPPSHDLRPGTESCLIHVASSDIADWRTLDICTPDRSILS